MTFVRVLGDSTSHVAWHIRCICGYHIVILHGSIFICFFFFFFFSSSFLSSLC